MSEIEKIIDEVFDSLSTDQLLEIHQHSSPGYMLHEKVIESPRFEKFLWDSFRVRTGEAGEHAEELIRFACGQCVRHLCQDESYRERIEDFLEDELITK